MSNPLRLILFGVGGLLALVAAAALLLFLGTHACRSGLEAAASAALGMEVGVGRSRIGIFRGVHVKLEDVQVRSQGTDVAHAEEVDLEIDPLALLGAKVRITGIGLKGPRISLERDLDGKFNLGGLRGDSSALDLEAVSVSDGALRYADRRSEREFEAEGCSLAMRHLRLSKETTLEPLMELSFTAELACGVVRTGNRSMTALKLSVGAKNGAFDLDPVSMHVFGGEGSGSIRVDSSGAIPVLEVHFSVAQFQIGEFLKSLSPDGVAEGTMDFSANLSMRGRTWSEIAGTAGGDLSLRGEHLVLYGNDLDLEFSRYESSQNFNLVDAGAFFFAGPLGLVISKGYNFSSIFQGSGGDTEIRTLVSDWKVQHGIAHAKDVAMATNQHRIALSGGLDLATQNFDDVTVALIDEKGCSRVQQRIRGPFQEPVVERPSVMRSVAGPALNLFKRGRALFSSKQCEVFYAGSVAPPKGEGR